MINDLRSGVRALRATPVISAVAVLSLGLGIGANTAIFSIYDSLVLRSLPVRDPGRLVQLFLGPERSSWTNPLWEQLRAHPDLFDGAFAWSSPRMDLSRGGESQFVNGLWASGQMFDVLGVRAVLGRTLEPQDDLRGGGKDGSVAVISYRFWQRHFGGATNVIGQPLTLERVPFTIVGVTAPGFEGLDPGRAFDVAIPLGAEPLIRGRDSALDRRSYWWLNVAARLEPGQTQEAATAAFRGVQPQMREATIPQNWRPQDLSRYLNDPFVLKPAASGVSSLRRRYQQPLTVIMTVVALVLLIACANIANLMLARATAREHELSVRLALGASKGRLARLLLAESLVLSACGGVLGLAFAKWGSGVLVHQLSTATTQVFLNLSIDWRVLAFTLAISVGTAVLFGVAPAFLAARSEPGDALKQQGRAIASGSRGFGSLLVVAQISLTLVLLVVAALFIRNFSSLISTPPGFDRDRVLIVDIDARRSIADPEARVALYERARQAVLALPGVSGAAVSAVTPVSGSTWDTLIENPEGLSLSEDDRDVYVNSVSPDWFRTYGTALVAGRDFTAADRVGSPDVIVVNETLARKYFAGRSPLGRTLREAGRPGQATPALEIVGVVKDAVYSSLRAEIPPTMYRPLAQEKTAPSSMSVSVRSAGGPPARLARTVAEALGAVDRDFALTFRPLASDLRASLNQERIVAMLSGFFGGLALLLAGIGLYGVMAYTVSRRRREIGIRVALGAAPRAVVALVLRRVAYLVGAGAAIGLLASMWASRAVAPLLYRLQPRDPATIAAAVVVLAVVGAAAGWLPARRAARVDPARLLRES
ncbi:MAG: hypothetical protein A3G21_14690 [Acidobacteria bacterium RIFCSPLOWO2_12_FULL_66_21]|nr:MAG: hypothetical protein A3G21_14690 [Acidobacteria bacterium RIFCSPLOWO2_12_FULL_66_21]